MFADPLDQASHLADMANEEAVAETRRRAAPEQVQNPDGSWPSPECCDCGEDIEPARLEMGKIRCFACQDALEKRNKQFGGR